MRYAVYSVPVFSTPARARRLLLWGVTSGSNFMRKSLRRVLERLRAATNETLGRRFPARGRVQELQRMQPALVPARSALRD